ncbi:MAG: hypothetical protein ACNA7J_00795 [Wenzhouxiangella sp.]
MLPHSDLTGWDRSGSRRFVFLERSLDLATGEVLLGYELDGIRLEERIKLPVSNIDPDPAPARLQAMESALDLLHWVAAVSYWKAGCPPRIDFTTSAPDPWQAEWLSRLYRKGLAEFAWSNDLDPDQWPDFPATASEPRRVIAAGLAQRTLVPMGGGKDSLVAWSRLQKMGESTASVQIGPSGLIAGIGNELAGKHWVIGRRIDPNLGLLNRQGAWNGHVPVTAINSAILVLAALVLDYDAVAFANERSADEASRIDHRGRAVNHQFSKSFEFELMLSEWIRRCIATDLRVYSLLRRDRELGICREFADLSDFHDKFSSCNRNFHLDGPRTTRWCGQCPKCHFVFLALAPFMAPAFLTAIFGRDLLAEPGQIEGFCALLALDGNKPFECVGEADEARAAIVALAADVRWSNHAVVAALTERLAGIPVPALDTLCRPHGPHLIPERLIRAA